MGIQVWMLTGDSRAAAEAVAHSIGIKHVQAGTLPGQKAKKIQALQARGHRVCMLGDGINDSPALAQADVGVAIGTGAQVACEAADLILLHNSLPDLVTALHLARTVFRRIQLNMLWALGYNLIGIPFAAGAFLPILGWRLPPGYSGACSSLPARASRLPRLARDVMCWLTLSTLPPPFGLSVSPLPPPLQKRSGHDYVLPLCRHLLLGPPLLPTARLGQSWLDFCPAWARKTGEEGKDSLAAAAIGAGGSGAGGRRGRGQEERNEPRASGFR
ncbi:p-type atpase [Nannochloropsis gaditana]|nr:p-type atpase [Nannochloropsis gaditana]